MVFVQFEFCEWFSFERNLSLQIGVGGIKENVVSVSRMYGGLEGRHLLGVCPRFLLGHHRKLVAKGLWRFENIEFENTQISSCNRHLPTQWTICR